MDEVLGAALTEVPGEATVTASDAGPIGETTLEAPTERAKVQPELLETGQEASREAGVHLSK
jgi:hypothetical protein